MARPPGLRLQIVLALGGLLLLAFVPLSFAVARLTNATLHQARIARYHASARAIATHVGQARASGGPEAVLHAIESQAADGNLLAAREVDLTGTERVVFGSSASGLVLEPSADHTTPARALVVQRWSGAQADIRAPLKDGWLLLRFRTDAAADPGEAIVRLTVLYVALFALGLLTFAYFSLTRLIVRPVEELGRAADRVAGGARQLVVPKTGARELVELSASVQAMTVRLLADEEALRRKVEELTQATTRLEQAKVQLARSERLASVGRLAAGIGHEIGNPIAALMGMEDLLLEGDLPEHTQRDFLQRMRKETERIHTVLRDLLDFARPEVQPDPTVAPQPARLGRVVDDVTALLEPQKHFKSIQMVREIDDEAEVSLPAPRLTQVLLNLLLNAADAIASKGREGKITLRSHREGTLVRLEVEDDGPGVPSELHDLLFEPFVTTKDVGDGTGLGLAVCRGLVEAAGGEIELDRSYSRGARFVIRLPIPRS